MEALHGGTQRKSRGDEIVLTGKNVPIAYSIHVAPRALELVRTRVVSTELTVEATFIARTAAEVDALFQSDAALAQACTVTIASAQQSAHQKMETKANAACESPPPPRDRPNSN